MRCETNTKLRETALRELRAFLSSRCWTNKESNMTHDEKLYEKCVKIYEQDGQDAVIAYCTKIDHKTWGRCEPCDYDESPIMDDNFMTCLVCGHSTYHDNENKTVSLSVLQLKTLLEATNYFLDALEDDEETEFQTDKYAVAKINQILERAVKNDK